MKLFIKNSIIFLLPLLLFLVLLVGSFYMYDPFKVVHHYDEFYTSNVGYNEDYVATERYLKNKFKYNSFIFGSSRAGCGYSTQEWSNKIKVNPDSVFSFAASNESLFGIKGKIELLDKEGTQINNVLLIIDADKMLSKMVNSTGHLFIKHPLVSKEPHQDFIFQHLKDYIFTGFFIRYIDYKIFKTKRNYMTGYINFDDDNEGTKYIAFNLDKREKEIERNEYKYYELHKDIFYYRNTIQQYSDRQIFTQQMKFFNIIKQLFNKHKTDYKIIISPLYDQKKINRNDLDSLIAVFGQEHIYDFSGINEITQNKHNYYESSHYRTHVGTFILNKIYGTPVLN